jgi:UDP-N-acetyl-D-galactosamine dehydrogenase
VVEQLVLEMARKGMVIAGAKVLVLGLSFKENCPDLRNTRVVDLIQSLQRYGMEPLVVDPWVGPEEAQRDYGLTVLPEIPSGQCWSAVVVAVAHQQFRELTAYQWQQLITPDGLLVDLKGLLPRQLEALRL